ncbi:MAG: glycosyltransferase family 4 protein [Ferruginibacter sp.]|nr:glycosyltransferase family 4 protein [Ferruginibacter sp.]
MKRLNVLISAHELSPFQGSECSEGWNIVSRLGLYHNLTVLYAKGSQFKPQAYETALNKYFSENPNPYNINFIPIEQPRTTLFLVAINKLISKKNTSIGNPVLYFLGYKLWEKKAYEKAKQLSTHTTFDITHHLTSISYREPGFLWKLPVPFVWGPTGGMSTIPVSYFRFIGLKSAVFEVIRSAINTIQFYTNIRIFKAIKHSSLIYTFSKEDQSLFAKRMGKLPKLMLDAASVAMQNHGIKDEYSDPNYLSIVWCGQLIKRKALQIVFFALSSDDQLKKRIKLKIVGSGPMENYYKTLSGSLGLNDSVEWMGQVDRQKVFDIMKKSDLFVHSSYREATSNVIPEALSNGLPVICHDINGMSIAINDTCGIKIPLISPEISIEGFKNALLTLVNNPEKLTTLRLGAFERAKEISWDSMAEIIANDYYVTYKKKNHEGIINK